VGIARAFPAIFDDPVVGVEARKLYDEARSLLDDIVQEKRFRARGALGLGRRRARRDIQLYAEDGQPLEVFHALRQQMKKPAGRRISRWRISSRRSPWADGLCGGLCGDGRFEVHEVADEYERQA